MSTDYPKSRSISERASAETRPRGGGRGDAPSVKPVNRLYLQAQSSGSDVFLLHPIALGSAQPRLATRDCDALASRSIAPA
jgi:hypothetical protein